MKDTRPETTAHVTLVVGTVAGGTGAYVRMLVTGLASRGIDVAVAGPSSADARFSFSAVPSVSFSPVEITDRPRAGDLAETLRLRRLLLSRASGAPGGRSPDENWPSGGHGASPRGQRPRGDSRDGDRGRIPGILGGGSGGDPSGEHRPPGEHGHPPRSGSSYGDPRDGGGSLGSGHVVHAHGVRAGALTVLALMRIRRGRPGVVVTVHNAPGGGVAGLLYRLLERIVARGADLVLCVSPDLEGRMRAAGARRVERAVIAAPDPVAGTAVGHASGSSHPLAPAPAPHLPDAFPGSAGGHPAGASGPDAPAVSTSATQRLTGGATSSAGSVAFPGSAGAAASGGTGSDGTAARDATGDAAGEAAGSAGAGRPTVLAIGRLARQKGFDVLLEAAAAWQDLDPMPLVVIVGDGPLAGQLRARAVALGTAAVFLGHLDDVSAYLASAAVFVLPSRWEGQPLALQEALRAGRPIVATRVGGVPSLTGDDAALLVPPGDARALGAAVRSVLTGPALAARLRAAAARHTATLPSEADAVTAALSAYASVIRASRP